MRVIQKRFVRVVNLGVLLCAVAILTGVSAIVASPKAVAASDGDVVINEIMYNPSTGNQFDEFLELYNTTGLTIDLTGWSFSAGIVLTFASGMTIPSHGYVVVSPNLTNTLTTYGVTGLAQYTGNLSNGGETVTLVDDTLNVIDTVSFDDASPWPLSPDGVGPSLELKATNLDNSVATNWAASLTTGGTPGASNSVVGLSLPTVSNVNDPNDVTAGSNVTITADITGTGITSTILKYKVNFGSDSTLTMYDDGTHGDATGGDDQYTAVIPGQVMGSLVRFRVEAENASGTKSAPSSDDSINYYGYYIKDPSVTSVVPILEWFIDDADYTTLYDQADLGIVNQHPAVIVYGNDVFDNASVRAKGSNTLSFPKKSIKVDLPAGHTLTYPGMNSSLKEFHLNANYKAENAAKVPTIFWAMKQAGMPVPDTQLTELRRNGGFEGAYFMVNKYKDAWRADNGFSNGELYEDYWNIDSGASTLANLDLWKDHMTMDRKSSQRRDYLLDENNIPALINYMAMATITKHYDFSRTQNIFYFRNNDTERWQVLNWDHDGDLISTAPRNQMGIYDFQDRLDTNSRFFLEALYDEKDMREAYYRRLKTLVDRFYVNDGLKNKYDELSTTYQDLSDADLTKWPNDNNRESAANDLALIARMKVQFVTYFRNDWLLPAAQNSGNEANVSVSLVSQNADPAQEFIVLHNSDDTPVDVSGWVVDGASYTLPQGSVIPKNSSAYIVRNDIGFKAGHASVLVFGEFGSNLSSHGTISLKNTENTEISSYDY